MRNQTAGHRKINIMHGVLAKNQQPKQRCKVDKRYC